MMLQSQLRQSPSTTGSRSCQSIFDNSQTQNIRSRITSRSSTTSSTSSSSSSPSTLRSTLFISSSKNISRNSSRSPVLLSVFAWSITLLLISSSLGFADAGLIMGHPLGKRSFMQLQCKGVYDKSIFARLDRICEDCYNLFREPQLHTLCRKNCFTSDYFKGCLDVLLLHDELEQIQTWIKQLHGADPGV